MKKDFNFKDNGLATVKLNCILQDLRYITNNPLIYYYNEGLYKNLNIKPSVYQHKLLSIQKNRIGYCIIHILFSRLYLGLKLTQIKDVQHDNGF